MQRCDKHNIGRECVLQSITQLAKTAVNFGEFSNSPKNYEKLTRSRRLPRRESGIVKFEFILQGLRSIGCSSFPLDIAKGAWSVRSWSNTSHEVSNGRQIANDAEGEVMLLTKGTNNIQMRHCNDIQSTLLGLFCTSQGQ